MEEWKRYWNTLKAKYSYDDSMTLVELKKRLPKHESSRLFHAMKYWH